jgi:multidrug efflux pump subunit AcrB
MASEKQHIWQSFGMFFYRRRLLTLLLWITVVTFGIVSYTSLMRKEGFPSVEVPIGVVRVISFDGSAQHVDETYTKPIIDAVQKDSLVKDVTSSSTDQGATVQISYKDGADVQKSLNSIKSSLTDKLPAGAQVLYIKVNAGKLTTEGDDILVSVHRSGLTIAELDQKAAQLQTILRNNAPLVENAHAFKLIESAVDPVSGEPVSGQVRFDRYYDQSTGAVLPSAIVGVKGIAGVDQIKLYDQVEAIVKSDKVSVIGADVAIASDFAENIRSQVSGLQQNLLEGLAVVLVVSFILISLRSSVVTALSMATTVIGTIGVLHLVGYTINTITLFSLVLCLALIVDDTTIMVEAIDAGLENGGKFSDVVRASFGKVARASATGTFTTILAFAPMLFIGGILGKFIRGIPITIIISLLVSLLVSFIFIPLMMRLMYGKTFKLKVRKPNIVGRAESRLGSAISGLIVRTSKKRNHRIGIRVGAVLLSLAFLVGGGALFTRVGFNIFPSPKDGVEIAISGRVRDLEHASIGHTEVLTDQALEQVRQTVGSDLVRVTLMTQSGSASRAGFNGIVSITKLHTRKRTSVEIAKQLETAFATLTPEMRLTAESAGVGPPAGNFTVQIKSNDSVNSYRLAQDVKTFLSSAILTRTDKTTAKLEYVSVTPINSISRVGTEQVINVSGSFSDKDTSTLVSLAQDSVKKEFGQDKVASYGLDKKALAFNFGQEDENQKSFASMGQAAGPLFLAMFIVMAFLFRSLLQPLLILMAIPFAFFGVAFGLFSTHNDISFFSMLGVFALIGISLNNTILLTDYANQAQKEGKSPSEAIAGAIKARLRPLLTTSITSVLALLPLALADPFWEGLAFALIFGLLSSTLLVLTVFPYFYLINESLSSLLRKLFRRVVKTKRA